MHPLAFIGQHWSDLWFVALGALLLAVVEHLARKRQTRRYDAWWYFNLRPSAARLARRETRAAKRRRMMGVARDPTRHTAAMGPTS